MMCTATPSALVCRPRKPSTKSYLCASLEEKAFESRAGSHQGLDAVLGDLITPGDVELLQEGTTLTDRGKKSEKDGWEVEKTQEKCCRIHPNNDATHLRALSDRLVIEVQEARSRCFSFGQNLLRLLHVLHRRNTVRLLIVFRLWWKTVQNSSHTCQWSWCSRLD